MTPFRSTRKWVENLVRFRQGRRELPENLCGLICRGVSLTDNVPEELLDRYLAVRTASSPKTDLVVVRLFDLSDFELVWEQAKTRATVFGELPTAMLLRYGARHTCPLKLRPLGTAMLGRLTLKPPHALLAFWRGICITG